MADWKVLVRGGAATSVSRCPEGHIHVEYGDLSLKLDDPHFMELADVLCAAARKLGGRDEACGDLDVAAAPGRFRMN